MDDFDADQVATQETLQPARRRSAIRPVTIRQLARTKIGRELTRSASRPRYELDGDEFSIATFVGNIINVVALNECRTIRIEDGTGKMTLNYKPIEEVKEEEDPVNWRAGTYARVFGVPSEFKESVTLKVHFIRTVDDYHEVLFHLMEAIVVTLQHSRGQPLLRPHRSQFATTAGPPLPSQSQPSQSTVLGANEESQDSVIAMPSRSPREDTSDDGGGSTEYYTDPPDSPPERSPSPSSIGPFAGNHSYEGHSDLEEGPSSQSTQRPKVRSGDKEDEDGRTPRGESKLPGRNEKSPKQDSDDELDLLRSEFSSQTIPFTPPKLKPDPYSDWSPAKRKIMVLIRSKSHGEEVNIKRSLGEGISKIEMRNAIKELVREGEIETVDGMNYWGADKGPKYPNARRF